MKHTLIFLALLVLFSLFAAAVWTPVVVSKDAAMLWPTSQFNTPTATGQFGTPTVTPTPFVPSATYCPPRLACDP